MKWACRSPPVDFRWNDVVFFFVSSSLFDLLKSPVCVCVCIESVFNWIRARGIGHAGQVRVEWSAVAQTR